MGVAVTHEGLSKLKKILFLYEYVPDVWIASNISFTFY